MTKAATAIPKPPLRPRELEDWLNFHIYHPLAWRLALRLARTPLTPNMVSVIGAMCIWAAALAYAQPGWPLPALVGMLLHMSWHVVDGADGDLARITGRVSPIGEMVDGICDYVGHIVLYLVLGWLLASLAGIALGVVVGLSATVRAYLQPMLEFVRPLPASALLPLAIAIFGLNPAMVLAVVAFGAMWPVLLGTIHGLVAVQPRLQEVARCLGLSRRAYVWKIGLPNALPDILAGMRLALTVALIVSVVGEMIASQPGLGQAILLAARAFRASELFAGIVLLGLIGLVSNALLALAEAQWLKWQRR